MNCCRLLRPRRPFEDPLRWALALLFTLAACQQEVFEAPAEPVVAVEVEELARGPFQARRTVLGAVAPSAAADVLLPEGGVLHYPPRFAGGLRSGEAVRAGEVLARIENPRYQQALAEARLRARSEELELERVQRGAAQEIVAQVEVARQQVAADLAQESLAGAEKDARRLEVRSPLGGHLIVESPLAPGTEVAAGIVLARIAGQGPPRVEGWAAAADRSALAPGLRVSITLPGGETPVAEGVLREISPVVAADGTLHLVADLEDPAAVGRLPAPGEGVELRIEEPLRQDALTVPENALILDGAGAAVFVLEKKQGHLRAGRRAVRLGGRGDGRVEVVEGLREGEKVAVQGAAFLFDGAAAEEVASDGPGDGRSDAP